MRQTIYNYSEKYYRLLLILVCTFLFRVLRGYRPFPSGDDFTYIVWSWITINPEMYSRDIFFHSGPLHSVLWPVIVNIFELTIGLPDGFWLLTLLLSVSTITVVANLFQIINKNFYIFPIVLIIAFASPSIFQGIGRGIYDGLFGDAFHVQWLGLLFLLWTYFFAIRNKPILCGVLLGLSALSHPVIAFHGAMALSLVFLSEGKDGIKQLLIIGITSIIIFTPALSTVLGIMTREPDVTLSGNEIYSQLLFRLPEQFYLEAFTDKIFLSILLLYIFLIIAGVLFSRKNNKDYLSSIRLEKFWIFHFVLFIIAIIIHSPWIDFGEVVGRVAYYFSLTRTTPLFFCLSSIYFGRSLSESFTRLRSDVFTERLFTYCLIACFAIFTSLVIDYHFIIILLIILSLLTYLQNYFSFLKVPTSFCLVVLLFCSALYIFENDIRKAQIPKEQLSLYSWIKENTSEDSLFIIPPSFYEFRYYSKRSAYVDFKIFTNTTSLISLWRTRLETVSHPDELALKAKGWEGIKYWDRSYALRNSEKEIESMLRKLQVDYFIYDLEGLKIVPRDPFATEPILSGEQLNESYRNSRYIIYSINN